MHDHFWPLIDELHRRGVLFCPACGRQYYNLLERFADIADEVVFIAENGTYVVHAGPGDQLRLPVSRATPRGGDRGPRDDQRGASTPESCCAASGPPTSSATTSASVDEIDNYYRGCSRSPDLLAVTDDDILKVSIFDFGSAEETSAPPLAGFRETHQVTVSSLNWIDITSLTANKGAAIRALQRAYGITPGADHGVRRLPQRPGDDGRRRLVVRDGQRAPAAAASGPAIVAPSNLDNGVVRTISSLLGLDWH